MDDTVSSTIEKLKLQEHDTGLKLKEKRELEAGIAALKRTIRDLKLQIDKSLEGQKELVLKTDTMQSQLEIENIRHHAATSQLHDMHEEYLRLRLRCDQGISRVWNLRSSVCQAVNNVSDHCDIWALLVKPACTEPLITSAKINHAHIQLKNENRLQVAKERHKKVIAERNRLRNEPENGEEFIRIKNALNYSVNHIAQMRK